MPRKARRIPDSVWEQYKDEIIEVYYSAPKGTLKKTMQVMKERHDFHATKSQYTTKFDDWGLGKYANHNTWVYVYQVERKRKLEEGKDTGFEIRGRKRSKAEIKENIARNVTHTDRLQLLEDIPTPEGVQVFTPVAEASTVALREAYIDNLPCFQPLKDVQGMVVKTMSNPTFQSSTIFDMPVFRSKQIGPILHSFSSVAKSFFGGLFAESGMPKLLEGNLFLIYHSLRNVINNNEAFLCNFGAALIPSFMWLFILLINNSEDHESFAAVDWMLKNINSSFLCSVFRLETIAVKTFMRKIFRGVVNSGNITVAKSIIDQNIDIKSHGRFHHSRLQGDCMQIAVDNRDNRMVELLCRAGFSPRINKLYGQQSEKLPWHTGNLEVLRTLLSFESNPECLVKNREPGFPLVDAANSGSLDAVDMLLMKGCRINVYVPSHFGTPLQAAVAGGHTQIAQFLIDRGADITAPCDIKYALELPQEYSFLAPCEYSMQSPELVALKTPVEIACYNDNILLVKMLLAHGALADLSPLSHIPRKLLSLHDKVMWVSTALQYSVQNRNIDLIRLLLSYGANPNSRVTQNHGDTSLQISARRNYPEIAQVLLDYGADVNATPAELNGRTAIQAAAEIGNFQLAQILLSRGANVNAPACENNGFTALQAAIKNSHFSMVRLLLMAGADVNAPAARVKGLAAIQAAAEIGDFNIIKSLVEYGADVNILPSECFGITAISAALQHKNSLMLEFLVDHGANIDGIRNETPPILAAADSGWVEGARYLLQKGADVNAITNYDSPLRSSIENDDIEMVALLLENGGDLSIGPHFDDALCIALEERCSPDLISLLLSKYAVSGPSYFHQEVLAAAIQNIHKDTSMLKTILKAISKLPKPLYEAQVRSAWIEMEMRFGYGDDVGPISEDVVIETVDILLEAGAEINEKRATEDSTLLQVFIECKYFDVCRHLVEKGAEINIPATTHTGTPLQETLEVCEIDFAYFLVKHGADINAPPAAYWGRTALQAAIELCLDDLVSNLLQRGADVNASPAEKCGVTALQAAIKGGHNDLVSDLLQRGADVNASSAEERGVTALQAAAIDDNIDVAILLIQHGAHVAAPAAPFYGRTAINGAAERGNLDMLQLLLNHYDGCENLRDVCHKAAHYSEEGGHFEIARWLREYTDV